MSDTPEQQAAALLTQLAGHNAALQMIAGEKLHALLLKNQAEIVARVAIKLIEVLEQNPDLIVTVDPQLRPGMAQAYLDALGISTSVPDELPKDW